MCLRVCFRRDSRCRDEVPFILEFTQRFPLGEEQDGLTMCSQGGSVHGCLPRVVVLQSSGPSSPSTPLPPTGIDPFPKHQEKTDIEDSRAVLPALSLRTQITEYGAAVWADMLIGRVPFLSPGTPKVIGHKYKLADCHRRILCCCVLGT